MRGHVRPTPAPDAGARSSLARVALGDSQDWARCILAAGIKWNERGFRCAAAAALAHSRIARRYTGQDTMRDALGIGLGGDPRSADESRLVYEKELQALPSFATMLAYHRLWYAEPGTGMDLLNVVHVEIGFENHAPFPVGGAVRGQTRVTAVEDKGVLGGALLTMRCEIYDSARGVLVSTLHSASLARAHGGFEAAPRPASSARRLPDHAPDAACDIATMPQAALIYQLSADLNSLHADPELAERAGFPGPILHGCCTFRVAAWALLRLCCGYNAQRLKRMRCRFSSPVFSGETVRTEIWREGAGVHFRASVPLRGAVVLPHGEAEIAEADARAS